VCKRAPTCGRGPLQRTCKKPTTSLGGPWERGKRSIEGWLHDGSKTGHVWSGGSKNLPVEHTHYKIGEGKRDTVGSGHTEGRHVQTARRLNTQEQGKRENRTVR